MLKKLSARSTIYPAIGLTLVTLYYIHILDNWWAWDDFHWLVVVQKFTPYDYFFNPSFYDGSRVLFHPVAILTYEINYKLFGLNPGAFYGYQILVILLIFLFTFHLLRFWCSPLWSLSGSLVTCVSGPVLIAVYQLQCAHYLQGLLFTVLSFYLLIQAHKSEKWAWTIPGAFLYLMACLCKEIYVPLIIFFPFLIKPEPLRNIKYWMTYGVSAIIYVIWRISVLGIFTSGYGIDPSLPDLGAVLFNAGSFIAGREWWGISVMLFYILSWFVLFKKGVLHPLVVAILVLLLIIPLYPIAYRINGIDRALILFAWIFCISVFLAAFWFYREMKSYRFVVVAFLLFFSIGVVKSSMDILVSLNSKASQFKTVGEFVLTKPENSVLMLTGQFYRAREVLELRELVFQNPGAELIYDPNQIDYLMSDVAGKTIYYFNEKANRIEDITQKMAAFRDSWKERTTTRPLSLEMNKTKGQIRWKFGPYKDYNYSLVMLSDNFAFTNIYFTGLYPAHVPEMDFILRYQSPDGWVTYSDVLHWNSQEGEKLLWSR